jgi:hypothetical protein
MGGDASSPFWIAASLNGGESLKFGISGKNLVNVRLSGEVEGHRRNTNQRARVWRSSWLAQLIHENTLHSALSNRRLAIWSCFACSRGTAIPAVRINYVGEKLGIATVANAKTSVNFTLGPSSPGIFPRLRGNLAMYSFFPIPFLGMNSTCSSWISSAKA